MVGQKYFNGAKRAFWGAILVPGGRAWPLLAAGLFLFLSSTHLPYLNYSNRNFSELGTEERYPIIKKLFG